MALRTINIQNHAYFVTSKVFQNKKVFLYKKCCNIVIDTLRFMEKQQKFELIGYVVMPNHLHLLLWPQGKWNISEIMRDFKKYTSRRIIEELKKMIDRSDQEIRPSPEADKKQYTREAQNSKREAQISRSEHDLKRIMNPTFSELLDAFTVNTKKQQYKVWQ